MKTKIEKTVINYKGKKVSGLKLTVTSEIPIEIEAAWTKVQTSKLLNFVTKGKVKFKPTGEKFPEIWKKHDTVSTKMFVHGFIPFGGVHTLYFEKIDGINKIMQTREWDNSAKVWNHKITLIKLNDKTTLYEDEIEIYGGMLTCVITLWAKSFYKHRQRRWQLLAEQNQT